MRYRALVGMKKTAGSDKMHKAEREELQIRLMKDLLKYWDSTDKVMPYYDPNYDTDQVYASILKRNAPLPKGINIDNPLEVMNFIGKTSGYVFYTEIPKQDKKARDKAKREWENIKKQYKKNKEDIPYELEEQYKHEIIEPVMSNKTKLYAYSTINPNGMFSSYNYPIEHSYIEHIKDVDASRLLNRNYGTMHDIVRLGDLDFDGTFFPNVVFRNDGEIFETYPDYDEGEADPGGDADDIKAFLEETLDRTDYVAMIECYV